MSQSVLETTLKSLEAKRKQNDSIDKIEQIPKKKPREDESDTPSPMVAFSSSIGTTNPSKITAKGPTMCIPTLTQAQPKLPPPPPPFPSHHMLGMSNENQLPNYIKPKDKFDVDVKLKTVHWKAITPQKIPENSFWVKCQESKLASEEVFAELTEKFPLKPANATLQPSKNKKKDADLRVIDVKSAQNILITFHAILKTLSYGKIKECVLRCDTSILQPGVVQQLIRSLPPPDQIKKLQQIKSNGVELSEVEELVATLGEIHGLVPRLHSINFKLCATDKIEDVEQNIKIGMAACEEIKTGKKFGKILGLILELGNYMNCGSKNGQAYAFEFSSLTKLMDIKSSNNKQSFLHFVVETVEQKYPELLCFGEDFSNTEKATRIRFDIISNIIDEMTTSLNQFNSNLEDNKLPQSPDDKFFEVMTDFATQINKRVDDVIKMMKQMKSCYTEVTEYYALDTNNYTMGTFFSEIKSFKEMFAQAYKENVNARKVIQIRDTRDQTQPQLQHFKEGSTGTKTPFLGNKKAIKKHCRGFEIKLRRMPKSELEAALEGSTTERGRNFLKQIQKEKDDSCVKSNKQLA